MVFKAKWDPNHNGGACVPDFEHGSCATKLESLATLTTYSEDAVLALQSQAQLATYAATTVGTNTKSQNSRAQILLGVAAALLAGSFLAALNDYSEFAQVLAVAAAVLGIIVSSAAS